MFEKIGVYSYHGDGVLCVHEMSVNSYVEGIVKLSQVINMIVEYRSMFGTKEYYELSDQFKFVLKEYYNMVLKVLRDNNIYNYLCEQEYLFDVWEFGDRYINMKPYFEVYLNQIESNREEVVFKKKK